MLQNELYTFTDIITEGNTIKTNIELIPSHPIFAGHFPGQPLLPGVCTMQIVKEVLEDHLQKQTRLVKGNNVKFLAMITPEKGKLMQLKLRIDVLEEQLRIVADLSDNNVLFKFKGIFEKIN